MQARGSDAPFVLALKIRHLALVALPLLAACAQGAPIQTASTQRAVDATAAFVLPPPGGPGIVSVVERRYNNATQQEISLVTNAHTPGQNWIRVKLFGPVQTQQAGQTDASTMPISFGNVGAEARTALPTAGMQRSPYYVQNRYGPFGYATGRSGQDLCLYGWQKIQSLPKLVGNKGAIDIRLRICEANASEQQLLALMYGYTVSAFFGSQNWNPYGDPAAPPPTLGRSGADVFPAELARAEKAGPVRPAATAAPRRAVQAPTPPTEQPVPHRPLVPPPPEMMAEPPAVPLPPN